MSDDNVIFITAEELQAKIDGILAEFPMLADVRRACCLSHTEDDVRQEFGHEAARAWDELDTARWMLQP